MKSLRLISFLLQLLRFTLPSNAAGAGGYWIANEGQWPGDFQFKCEVGSTVYYVTPKGLTAHFREFKRYPKPRDLCGRLDILERHEERDSVTVRGHVVQIHYSGLPTRSGSLPPFTGEGLGMGVGQNKLPHYSNYFFGRDNTKWRSRVGHYQKVVVPEVWPGIDVEYRADKLGVETVYHVKPGADPGQIQMEYLGLDDHKLPLSPSPITRQNPSFQNSSSPNSVHTPKVRLYGGFFKPLRNKSLQLAYEDCSGLDGVQIITDDWE